MLIPGKFLKLFCFPVSDSGKFERISWGKKLCCPWYFTKSLLEQMLIDKLIVQKEIEVVSNDTKRNHVHEIKTVQNMETVKCRQSSKSWFFGHLLGHSFPFFILYSFQSFNFINYVSLWPWMSGWFSVLSIVIMITVHMQSTSTLATTTRVLPTEDGLANFTHSNVVCCNT